MSPLNPNSDDDRRITAFTRSFPIKKRENDTIIQGTYSYDCWGRQQGGLFKQSVTPEYSKKISGTKDHRSLRLMQQGCCPPQLMKEFIEAERFDNEGADAAEEAMKLHGRGYLGGGG